MVAVEVVDAAIVLVGLAWARRPPPLPPIGRRRRLAAWVAAAPILAAILLVNFAYMRLLKDVIRHPRLQDRPLPEDPAMIPWVVATVCIQPAIVEELFFRYRALGHLRPALGTPGAVLMSGVMFGVAHIFNPLGMPYLIAFGIVIGYVRVVGRSLAIPMLIHLAHNAAVLRFEPWL